MTDRENFFSIVRRTGYERMPAFFDLCPYLQESCGERLQELEAEGGFFPSPMVNIPGIPLVDGDTEKFRRYYSSLKEGAVIDAYGVAAEPGSSVAMHMTHMRHPLEAMRTLEEIKAYPYPVFFASPEHIAQVKAQNDETKAQDKILCGNMQCTVWETAWYMRSMEELMMDMLEDEEMAAFVLDKVTELAIQRAEFYAQTGADVLFLGDDVGMQHSVMMSEALYTAWLQPRLARVIAAARAINPDIIVFYHSCGYITPFIGHLVDAGVDVLNPVQPECMDFAEIHAQYGDRISFHGTIGTQSTMPFGTPEEVRNAVFRNLDIAGDKGGLLVGPTHMLEPEIPWENLKAYLTACKAYTTER